MPEDNKSLNHFFNLVHSHRSVRSFITGKQLPGDHELKIIEAAQRSSSSCNLQTTTFISIKDMNIRRRLTEICGNQEYVYQCSSFIAVCADLHKMDLTAAEAGYEYCQSRLIDSILMAVMDAAIASQTAALAAESLGYGICMIGGLRNDSKRVIDLLKLPKHVFPVFGICIGYPDERNPVRPRIPLKGVLFTDTYDDLSVREALDEYDQTMAESGIYNDREKPDKDLKSALKNSTEKDFYGWIEHTARRIASTDPSAARQALRKNLDDAGFGFK